MGNIHHVNYKRDRGLPISERWAGQLARAKIGKYLCCKNLPSWLAVHHKDGNRFNNDLSNLEILHRDDHTRIHRYGKGKYGMVYAGNEREYDRVYAQGYNKLYKQRKKEEKLSKQNEVNATLLKSLEDI